MNKSIYKDNLSNELEFDPMSPCPMCGANPRIWFIGNDYSKQRKVKIKCKNTKCQVSISHRGLYTPSETLLMLVVSAWNRRNKKKKKEAVIVENFVQLGAIIGRYNLKRVSAETFANSIKCDLFLGVIVDLDEYIMVPKESLVDIYNEDYEKDFRFESFESWNRRK